MEHLRIRLRIGDDDNNSSFKWEAAPGAASYEVVWRSTTAPDWEYAVNVGDVLEITVPESNVGDVYSDMSSRGGRVQGSDSAGGGYQTVFTEIPLREVTTYARTLSSMTGGQGSFVMELSHYEPAPPQVQQQIIAQYKPKVEEE